jgi:hypothetical protein
MNCENRPRKPGNLKKVITRMGKVVRISWTLRRSLLFCQDATGRSHDRLIKLLKRHLANV